MNDKKITLEQWGAYQKFYDYFNEKLFDNQLPGAMLNLSRRKLANGGHFSPGRWTGEEMEADEINLNPAGYWSGKEIKVGVSILVHEMVHQWQEHYGSPSRNGYHNKEWGTKMKEVGLHPSNTGEPGGKETGQQMTHYIIEGGAFDKAFRELNPKIFLPFASREQLKGVTSSRKSKVKQTCPDCESNAWGKPDLRLICGECYAETGEIVYMEEQ